MVSNSVLPKWQTTLINQIIESLKKNYIFFDVLHGKPRTEDDWRNDITKMFAEKFVKYDTQKSLVNKFRSKFTTQDINLYIVSGKDKQNKVNQAFIDDNKISNAIILYEQFDKDESLGFGFGYAVIGGKLFTDNLIYEPKVSFTQIDIPSELTASESNPVYKRIDRNDLQYNNIVEKAMESITYSALAENVTKILQTITRDEHMSMGYYPKTIEVNANSDLFKNENLFYNHKPLEMEIDNLMRSRMESDPTGIHQIPIEEEKNITIPSKMGYIRIKEIYNSQHVETQNIKEAIFGTMKSMQSKEIIVIDLRQCGGGTPQGMQYLASFFFDKPTQLTTYHSKDEANPDELHTLPQNTLSPKNDGTIVNLANKPVYILVGNGTVSAAEEFAYDLQNWNVATIVGTKSRGANHFARGEPLLTDDESKCRRDFILVVPRAYSTHPQTRTNWEDGPILENKDPGVMPNDGFLLNQDENALKFIISRYQQNLNNPEVNSTVLIHNKLNITPDSSSILNEQPKPTSGSPAPSDVENKSSNPVEVNTKTRRPTP